MALQEAVGVRTSYKFNASGDMTANTEADTSTIPGSSGAQELRRVSSTLRLVKDTYQSNEVRGDRQVFDFRHGVRRVEGDITGELSPATYWDFIEAACRGTAVAEFSKTETEFTSMAADNSASTFTCGGSTWAAQGFYVGDVIRFSNLSDAQNNSRNFLITALSGTTATVTPAPDTHTADTAFTVTRVGQKVSIPTSSHVKRLFTFEHYHQDLDIAQLFTECRVTSMQMQVPPTGLATVRFGVMGRGMDVLSGSSAPYFTSPTAITSTGITAGVNGKVIYEGSAIGVLTGIDFTLQMNADAPAVVGQNFVPEIFLGRSVVTGTFTALLEDETFLSAFKAESEIALLVLLTTTTADDSPFIAITIPRAKLSAADVPIEGETGLTITCPFQALVNPSTTGEIASTLAIQDSQAS